MAKIRIEVGPVVAERTFADNQKVSSSLNLFADWLGIPDDLPAQERLDEVIGGIVRFVVERARAQHVRAAAEAAQGEAEDIAF